MPAVFSQRTALEVGMHLANKNTYSVFKLDARGFRIDNPESVTQGLHVSANRPRYMRVSPIPNCQLRVTARIKPHWAVIVNPKMAVA